MVAYIAARTGDIADAQDALSEALVAALENWPTNGVPDKPEAWLMRVAHNRVIHQSYATILSFSTSWRHIT